ncbi:MAG: hypothetical protein N2C12_16120, partial [Planctomycetales bacterium]
ILERMASSNKQPQWRSVPQLVLPGQRVPRLVPLGQPVGQTQSVQQHQWRPVWTDDKLVLRGQAAYSPVKDQLEIESFSVDSRTLKIDSVKGSFSNLTTDPVADISGQLEYDLKKICELMEPYIGSDIRFVGSGKDGFRYRGRLPSDNQSLPDSPWWEGVTTEVAFSWDAFDVFGLKGGAADVEAMVEQGVVVFQPLEVPFNGGQLKTTPRIRMGSDPLLSWSDDTEVQQATLSEELCQTWLQYVAPMLSQATRAQGKFSVKLPEGEVPITDPSRGELSGTLVIHSAQIRPGPLTSQLVAVAMQVDSIIKRKPGLAGRSTVLNIAQQEVAFSLSDGRVHHKNFVVEIGDVVVQTTGSVGLDNTLQLVAEIPIRDKWVENDKFLRGLKGQSLRIPIRGTLGKPKLDNRVVTQLGKQMVGSAAGDLLEDALRKGLKKGLDKFFQ